MEIIDRITFNTDLGKYMIINSDDFRLYDREATEEEVKQFNSRFDKKETQSKKYYFVATEEDLMEDYKQWTIDNSSGSPHESRQDAINEIEGFKGTYPTKLIVVKSDEDINLSKEANEKVMEEVNNQIDVLNT